jgi:uncharacterized protein (DUF2249 family)
MGVVEIDNRGLQPPEPMVRILEVLSRLKTGETLEALMDREPLLLYPELKRRGFAWEFTERGDDYLLSIRRAAGP